MNGKYFEWLFMAILSAGIIGIILIGNEDASLGFAAFSMTAYVVACRNSAITINKNIPLLFSLLLLLVLATYRIMFNMGNVLAIFVNDAEMRNTVVSYGVNLVSLFILGAYAGLLTIRNKQWTKQPSDLRFYKPDFNYLLIVAWLPLITNIVLYFAFFRGKPYVDVHIYSHGPFGLILKSIYLTYAAIIIMAIGDYSKDRAFKAIKWLLLCFFVVFGLLLQQRSSLLVAILYFVYFYGQRLTVKMLGVFLLLSVLAFAAIGVMRDPETAQGNVSEGIVVSVLGMGEFADTLRYALDRSKVEAPLWGGGIVGSFLGITDPQANVYAKLIAPDYFDEGGGFGFFLLSDLLINFGEFGTPALMFVLGFMLVRLHYSGKFMRKFIFLPTLYSTSFGIVRNDLGSTFRGVVYTLLFVVIIRYVGHYLMLITTKSSKGRVTE